MFIKKYLIEKTKEILSDYDDNSKIDSYEILEHLYFIYYSDAEIFIKNMNLDVLDIISEVSEYESCLLDYKNLNYCSVANAYIYIKFYEFVNYDDDLTVKENLENIMEKQDDIF